MALGRGPPPGKCNFRTETRCDVAASGERKQPVDLWTWPVLAGLLVLVLEWWVYNKRVQI